MNNHDILDIGGITGHGMVGGTKSMGPMSP